MKTHQLLASWPWIKAVVVSSAVTLTITGAILSAIEKLLARQKLSKLSDGLRWVLVLPAAFLLSTVGEMIPRILFAAFEILVNHELTFRPGFDFVIWQLWSPLLFVAGAVQMSPKYHFRTFLTVGGLKIVVAGTNLVQDLAFTRGGGQWDALDPVTNAPVWWTVSVSSVCILLLGASGLLLSRSKPSASA